MDSVGTATTLFQFALETLGHIQLAREFQDDFDPYQLKLDIMQLRLSRWGEIASITTIDSSDKSGNEAQRADMKKVEEILGDIQSRLCMAQRDSKKLQAKLDANGAQGLDPESCLSIDLKKIHNRFMTFLHKRKIQTTKAVESLKWIFYQKEHFEKFIVDISELIDGLENTMPEEDRKKLRKLSDEECKGISKSNLEELKDIIDGCDPWLESSVHGALNARSSGTVINQSHNTGHTVGIHNGDINRGNAYGHATTTNTFN
ncbi:hypothetical protein NHQ30_008631 [Ciborinia camelliae]|nr:hypothetical protein NHQ30_008631 [Ciborinia camelliae]